MAQEGTISSEDVSGVRAPLSTAEQGRNLFLVGFLVLFMELACIRWFAAYVIFLQFFTNVMRLPCLPRTPGLARILSVSCAWRGPGGGCDAAAL